MTKREEQLQSIGFDRGYGIGILASSFVVSFTYLFAQEFFVGVMFLMTLWGTVFLFKSIYDRKKLK